MKKFSAENPAIPIADHVKSDGTNWTIKEKLWLGLTPQEYKQQFFRNWVNWLMIGLLWAGRKHHESTGLPRRRKAQLGG